MKKSEALKTLGLSNGATEEEIKKAHRKKVIENHPDKYASDPSKKAEAEERTKLINEARDVLISGKWDPEFDPRRSAAGSGYYTTNPYARPSAGQTSNPYAGSTQGWPFGAEDVEYVWTSWGNAEQVPRGQHSDGSTVADWFDVFYDSTPRKTAEEEVAEAKQYFQFEILAITAKVGILTASTLLSSSAMGMFLYVIASIALSFYKKLGRFTWIALIPAMIVFSPLFLLIAPSGGDALNIGTLLFFAVAILFDLSNLRRAYQTYNGARTKTKI